MGRRLKPEQPAGASAARELRDLNVRPQKSRGQNFLIDQEAIGNILSFASLPPDQPVVEVGPGLGAMTRELALRHPVFAAIEIEPELAAKLRAAVPGCRVIEADMREVRLKELFDEPASVISNVPYSISTDFALWLFREHSSVTFASLLLQKEFAERLAASEGSRAYGSLSVLRARYASAELGPIIEPEAFHPKPKVDSRLVRLDFSAPEISLGKLSEELFDKFVRACFRQKRKTLLNSLSSSELFVSRIETAEFLRQLQVPDSIRAEQIPPREFLRLAEGYASQHLLS